MDKRLEDVPAEAMAALVHYDWPGNVREVQNVMERAVILACDGVLRPEVPEPSPVGRSAAPLAPLAGTLDEAMRAHILEALRATNGVLGGPDGAAVRLGVKRTTLAARMEKLGIYRPRGALAW
jgi:formate hydrogenlyase transcriptional activator